MSAMLVLAAPHRWAQPGGNPSKSGSEIRPPIAGRRPRMAPIAKAAIAYFDMVNDLGGIHGARSE